MEEAERDENGATARPMTTSVGRVGAQARDDLRLDYVVRDFADAGEQPPEPEDASGAQRGDPTYR